MTQTLPCKFLRTKKMFIPAFAGDPAETQAGEPHGASHCWCNRTLTETGPDDRPVGFEVCGANRSCFEE